jgi:hypothetical protein
LRFLGGKNSTSEGSISAKGGGIRTREGEISTRRGNFRDCRNPIIYRVYR